MLWIMTVETLLAETGVYVFPTPRDPEVAAVLHRARELMAANTMWRWLIEVGKTGQPITMATVHEVAEGVRSGVLV